MHTTCKWKKINHIYIYNTYFTLCTTVVLKQKVCMMLYPILTGPQLQCCKILDITLKWKMGMPEEVDKKGLACFWEGVWMHILRKWSARDVCSQWNPPLGFLLGSFSSLYSMKYMALTHQNIKYCISVYESFLIQLIATIIYYWLHPFSASKYFLFILQLNTLQCHGIC